MKFRRRLAALLSLLAVLLVASAVSVTPARAQQQMIDVVYLKDGGIVRGIIIEQRPGESILIRTRDGSQFRYQMSQIDRMVKEGGTLPRATASPAPQTSARRKSPGLAWLLSFVYPGVGQMYNQQWAKGGVMIGMATAGNVVMLSSFSTCFEDEIFDDYYYTRLHQARVGTNSDFLAASQADFHTEDEVDEACALVAVGGLVSLGTWIWSMIDAPIAAGKINRRNRRVALELAPELMPLRPLRAAAGIDPRLAAARSGPRVGLSLVTLSF